MYELREVFAPIPMPLGVLGLEKKALLALFSSNKFLDDAPKAHKYPRFPEQSDSEMAHS